MAVTAAAAGHVAVAVAPRGGEEECSCGGHVFFSDCGGGDEGMWWLWWLMWSMGSLLLGKREGWRLVFLGLARVGEVGWKSTKAREGGGFSRLLRGNV